jgi:hypothetical protein
MPQISPQPSWSPSAKTALSPYPALSVSAPFASISRSDGQAFSPVTQGGMSDGLSRCGVQSHVCGVAGPLWAKSTLRVLRTSEGSSYSQMSAHRDAAISVHPAMSRLERRLLLLSIPTPDTFFCSAQRSGLKRQVCVGSGNNARRAQPVGRAW